MGEVIHSNHYTTERDFRLNDCNRMPSRNLITLILAAIVSLLCYHTASRNHYGGLLSTAIGEIHSAFVRPVDDRKLFEGAMEGMVRQLDPYSDYIDPDELSEFQEEIDQKFGGIGIVVEINRETERLTVLSPLPDTPAAAAGIRAGDQILAIDGKSTLGYQISDAVKLMRGDPGTELTVSILHVGADEPIDVTLKRAIIPVASVLGDVRNADGTWQYTLRSHPDIGYVRLTTFGEKTADELRETLSTIEPDIKGLILDLRSNGGGLLSTAVDICDMFISEGAIVSIRGRARDDRRDYEASEAATLFPDLPMVVLIDGFSASASEITAACLQDNDRAIVVGTRSWGKGTVQNVMPFEGGKSALKLTIATYWRPSGNNIHRHVDATDDEPWGVTPTDGYLVEVDDQTRTKIVLLRLERDKVDMGEPIEPEDLAPVDDASSEPADLEADDLEADEEPLDNESTSDTTAENPSNEDAPPLPDITGFEDPQLQRAIEAINELTSSETNP